MDGDLEDIASAYAEFRTDWDWYLVGRLNPELTLRPTASGSLMLGLKTLPGDSAAAPPRRLPGHPTVLLSREYWGVVLGFSTGV